MIELTQPQRRRLQRHFTAMLATLGEAAVFVEAETLVLHARSAPFDLSLAFVPRRCMRPLPHGIIAVGAYAHPFPSAEFLRDLLAAIARNERIYPASAAIAA